MALPMPLPAVSSVKAKMYPQHWVKWVALVLLLLVALAALVLWLAKPSRTEPLGELPLADGRTFLIEAVTFGTNHAVGRDASLYNRFGPWLPGPAAQALQPKGRRSEINTSHPSLVVWLNAIDSVGRTNVDCQGVRVEIGDDGDQWFGEITSHWFGGTLFWRVGHVFSVYPRHLTNFTVRITPWVTNVPAETIIPNPAPANPQPWVGSTLPQEQTLGDFTLRFERVILQTNHPSPKYYQTATRYWHPELEILEGGRVDSGWQEPVWNAQDPTGNRGRYLGIQQPILRYSAICYPSSTNEKVAELVASLVPIDVVTLQSNNVFNTVYHSPEGAIRFIGLFPASRTSAYVFSEGEYLSNPPVRLGGVLGGAPSGWTAGSQYVTPIQQQFWHGHYTHVPVIYLHAELQDTRTKLGLRLRTEDGSLIPVHMEPQGGRKGIWPFLITNVRYGMVVTPEIVLLHPLEATFDVDTTTFPRARTPAPAVSPKDLQVETVVDVFW